MTVDGSTRPPARVRFGVFELDLATGELRKRGARVALQEQPFQVLARLVARPGDLVTRDELRRALWPDAVFVDFDHGLNKAVAKIRRALGDLAISPRYVETLERRGYRFIASVEAAGGADRAASVAAAPHHARVVRLTWEERAVALGPGIHVVGRDPDCAVWVESSVVSRHHARITVGADRLTIEDLGSHNGTYVNGGRSDGVRPLSHGDVVRIGPASLMVHDPPDQAATDTDPVR